MFKRMKRSYILGAMTLLTVALFYSYQEAVGIFIGMLWGYINLYFIKQLMHCVLIIEKRELLKILLLLLIKFPLLYLVGYALLLIPYFSPWSLLIGFSVILIACTQRWFWTSHFADRAVQK